VSAGAAIRTQMSKHASMSTAQTSRCSIAFPRAISTSCARMCIWVEQASSIQRQTGVRTPYLNCESSRSTSWAQLVFAPSPLNGNSTMDMT